MVQVKTLRPHDNALGDKYQKKEGDTYDHPDPAQLIKDGLVERVTEKADADGEGGRTPGAGSRAK